MEPRTSGNDTLYKEAKARVESIREFYGHLAVYIVVNLGIFLINLVTSPGAWWFYWPLFGWGIGVLIHAFSVFGEQRFLGKSWEERKIREYMEHDAHVGRT
jgi:hypothetical protein